MCCRYQCGVNMCSATRIDSISTIYMDSRVATGFQVMQANNNAAAMMLIDRDSVITNITPANKTRLNDGNVMDILTLVCRDRNDVLVIDPQWSTQFLTNGNADRRLYYRDRITNALSGIIHFPSIVLLPLFADEHWSLLVLVTISDTVYHYFHLDSSQPDHAPYCDTMVDAITSLLDNRAGMLVKFDLPVKVPQQRGDWQCGHFVVMNASMIVSSLNDGTQPLSMASLARHLRQNMLTSSYRNIRQFALQVTTMLQ